MGSAAGTLGAYVRATARRFARARLHFGHGTDNPRDEAAFLVLRGLGLRFDADPARPLRAQQIARLEPLLRRRIRERIPVAYLLREAWLDGLRFYVDRRAVVPRSHIAELLAERLRFWMRRPVRRILDLCTGSGCLAILAARAFPHARIDASDLSRAALMVARKNVARYRLRRRVRLVNSDLFAGLRGARYDLILSNPPYVDTQAMRRLPAEYRYEPGLALAAGAKGLDFVSRIVEQAAAHLNRGGLLVCEIGAEHRRRALERCYPLLPFVWASTADPAASVFILARSDLARRGASRKPCAARKRPRRARARR